MEKMVRQRRRAVVLASCGAILATTPILLGGSVPGHLHHLVFGLAAGIALPLVVASLVLMRRGRRDCV